MGKGVNKVIIVGNLGQDPETRYMPSGDAVTKISVATSESWKDKQTGQQQERTEWHKIVFFGKLAEIAGQYLKKGSKVYVEGALRTNKWQDKDDGKDRYSTEIIGDEMQMLDSKGDNQQQGPQGQGFHQPPQQAPQGQGFHQPPQQAPQGQGFHQPPQQAPQGAGQDAFDDDIPF